MAKTLLNAVNEVLKRVDIIDSTGALTTLTDSARQQHIDRAVQAINEGMDELYSLTEEPKPQAMGENSITLATSTRSYSLQTDLVTLLWPLRDETNAQYIWEWEAGYHDLVTQDATGTLTGLPLYGVIDPTDGKLFLDRTVDSTDNGKVYKYEYLKDVSVSAAADTVPFTDAVFRAMVPVWAEIWRRMARKDSDLDMSGISFGRAARLLGQIPARTSWYPK